MNRAPRRNGKRGLDDGSINPQKRWLAVAFEHSKASCFKLLDALRSNREAGPFNIPVDPVALGCPDYLQKIKHPMDFGTVAVRSQMMYHLIILTSCSLTFKTTSTKTQGSFAET